MSGRKKFLAVLDSGCNTAVYAAETDSNRLAETIAAQRPPMLIGYVPGTAAACTETAFSNFLSPEEYQIDTLNAERYKGEANLREELLTDLTAAVKSKNKRDRIRKNVRAARSASVQKSGFFSAAAVCLCFLLLAVVLFAVLLGTAKLLEWEALKPYLPGESGFRFACWGAVLFTLTAAAVFLIVRFSKRKLTLRDKEQLLSKLLFTGRNRKLRHVVVLKNIARLDSYSQISLYNHLSSLLDCSPLTFVLELAGNSKDNFRAYFKDCFPATSSEPASIAPAERVREAAPAVRAILQNKPSLLLTEGEPLSLTEQKKLQDLKQLDPQPLPGAPEAKACEIPQPAQKTEEPENAGRPLLQKFHRDEEASPEKTETPVAGQLDLLDAIPVPQEKPAPSFNFAEATTKDIMHAFADGSLEGMDRYEVLYGALPRIHRMPEKTLNEYLTILSYTMKKIDLTKVDFSRTEDRVWAKLVGWYRGMGQLAEVRPLYEKALAEWNSEIVEAFLVGLDSADKQDLVRRIQQKLDQCYRDNAGFESVIPILGVLCTEEPSVKCDALKAVDLYTADFHKLAAKSTYCLSFSLLLEQVSDQLNENELERIYRFVQGLLAAFEDNETISAGMRIIAVFKERFRFQGLSIETLNDIIFNKNFTDMEGKLEYIDNLLGSPTLSDAEKTRYVTYLTGAQDTLEPKFRLKVLQSLIKGGIRVEKENILEAVKWFSEDSSQEFLDGLNSLLRTYGSSKGMKSEELLSDIAKQSLTVSQRTKILQSYLTSGFPDTAKVVKHLLKECLSEDETLKTLDFVEVSLAAISALSTSSKLPKAEFVETVSYLLEHASDLDSFKKLLYTLAVRYYNLSLNGDQKHDLKSGMFRGAQRFEGENLSVETSVILKVFKIEYISFVEQKIAKQGDPDVEKLADAKLTEWMKDRS